MVADFRDWIKSKTNIELQLNFKLEASRSSPLLQKVLRRDRIIAKLLLLYFFSKTVIAEHINLSRK